MDNSVHKSLYWELTSKCNLSCIHCYNNSGNIGNCAEISLREIKKVLSEATKLDVKTLFISGGEPFLRKDWHDILVYAVFECNLKVTLLTNGTLIDKNVAKLLSDLDVRVQISLDGSKDSVNDIIRGKGTYNKILKGIEALIMVGEKTGKKLIISTTLVKQNIEDIFSMISFVKGLGIHYIYFTFITKQGRAKKRWLSLKIPESQMYKVLFCLYEQSIEHKEKIEIMGYIFDNLHQTLFSNGKTTRFFCSAGKQLRIDSQGYVFPCPFFISSYCMGNVRKTSLKNLFSNKINKVIQEIENAVYLKAEKIETCKNCLWKYCCGGGCMANSYYHFGTIWHQDDFCTARKLIYERYISEFYRKFKKNSQNWH